MTARWLLIDVDGTLSPDLTPQGPAFRARSRSGDVAIPLASLRLLNQVRARGIRLAWYSAREEDTQELLGAALGPPHIPHVPLSHGLDDPNVLKAFGLPEWPEYQTGGRYAILDDVDPGVPLPTNARLFLVDPAVGLTAERVDAAVAWLGAPD